MAITKTTKPALDTEVANRLRDPFETHYLGVLRTNDPLLLERGNGGAQSFEMYRDLRRDGKVFSALQKRRLALIGRPWQVDPIEAGEAGQRDAAVVLAMLKSIMFDKLCNELLDALLVGFVPAEIVWTYRNNMWWPDRVLKRAQRRFVYVQADANAAPELRLLTAANMLTGEVLEPYKFIVHRVNPEDDNPYGMGLGLQLFWPVFFKRKGILSWNKLNDRFGSPTPWGKYPKSAGPKEKGTLFDALRAMSNDGVMMTPEGMSIELLESKLTGSISTQKDLCAYMDGWISEVILSQEATHQTGATGAASNEREDVRLDLVQADADLLSDTLNSTLIKWFCEFNGLAPCQVSRVVKKPEDLKAASETDVNVASMGFKPTLEAIRAKYGEGWEEATPPTPTPTPPAAPAPAPAPAAGGKAASFAEPVAVAKPADPNQSEIDLLMSASAPLWNAMVAHIQTMVDGAKSLPELQQALIDAYGGLDSAELVKLMAAALALAELKGMDAAKSEIEPPVIAFAETAPVVPPAPLALPVAPMPPAPALAPVIHVHLPSGLVQFAAPPAAPAPPAPVVQVDVHVPAPVVHMTNQVQPAPVTVHNAFPSQAVQSVVRDADLEITQTITDYKA